MRLAVEQVGRHTQQLREACGEEMLDALKLDDIEDLVLNPNGYLWQLRRGCAWEHIAYIDEDAAFRIVESVASIKGGSVHDKRPTLETIFPIGNPRDPDAPAPRFAAVLPPVSRRPVFALRVKRSNKFGYVDYEASGVLSDVADPLRAAIAQQGFLDSVRGASHGAILRRAAAARRSILIAGPTGSGKTSLADTHLSEIGATTSDRVIYIEDTPELVCDIANSVDLLACEDIGIDMLRCVRIAMRLRPKRIVVGEVRGGEAHALLKAWNTGHPGGIATVHADDAYSGLLRLESLVAESTAAPCQELIAQAVHLVVFIEEEPRLEAGRKVREIIAVTGYANGRYQFTQL